MVLNYLTRPKISKQRNSRLMMYIAQNLFNSCRYCVFVLQFILLPHLISKRFFLHHWLYYEQVTTYAHPDLIVAITAMYAFIRTRPVMEDLIATKVTMNSFVVRIIYIFIVIIDICYTPNQLQILQCVKFSMAFVFCLRFDMNIWLKYFWTQFLDSVTQEDILCVTTDFRKKSRDITMKIIDYVQRTYDSAKITDNINWTVHLYNVIPE